MNERSEWAPEQNEDRIFISEISSSSVISTASREHIRFIYTVSLQKDIHGCDTSCSANLKPEIQIFSQYHVQLCWFQKYVIMD